MAISSASGIASSCVDTASNFTTLSSKNTFGSFPLKSASVKNCLKCSSLSFWRRNGIRIDAVVKRSPKRSKYSAPRPVKSDGVFYLKVDPSGADAWRLEPVIELIKGGAVGVIPTDTVYAIVCDLKNRSAVERLHRIKKMDAKKPLGILCRSFRDIDTYTTGFPRGTSEGQTNIFRAARQCLPGPYTFILPASKEMPKECTKFGTAKAKYATRKSVGVRMPNDPICQAILGKLDGPLLCSSVRWPVDDEWIIDPAIIADIYGSAKGQEGVDFVVDGGIRVAEPSTVIDMTGNEPLLLRKGKVCNWILSWYQSYLEDFFIVKESELRLGAREFFMTGCFQRRMISAGVVNKQVLSNLSTVQYLFFFEAKQILVQFFFFLSEYLVFLLIHFLIICIIP